MGAKKVAKKKVVTPVVPVVPIKKKSKRGRKAISDKKITVAIYPRRSRIETIGIDSLKLIAHTAIEKEYFKQIKVI